MINIYTDSLPSDAVVYRLAGDFISRGYVDNFNRPVRFECVVARGKVCPVDQYGYVDLTDPLTVVDGEIQICGWEVTFLPDGGELARAGLAG